MKSSDYEKKFLKANEAAFLLNISRKTLYNWKNEGKIKASNLGQTSRGSLRIHISEIERLLGGKVLKNEGEVYVD